MTPGSLLGSVTSGVTTSVAAGRVMVKGDTNANQGCYLFEVSVAEAQAHVRDATNPRVNMLVARVYDATEVGSGSSGGAIEIVAGTPTAGATLDNRSGALALPASALHVADVLVPVTGSATIRDRRPSGIPYCRVLDAVQGIPTGLGGGTAISFNLAEAVYDTDSMHDPSTNPTRVTINTPGLYLFDAGGYFDANATGVRRLYLAASTGITSAVGEAGLSGTDFTYLSVTGVFPLAAGDYVQVFVLQNSGTTLNFNSSVMSAVRLGTLL